MDVGTSSPEGLPRFELVLSDSERKVVKRQLARAIVAFQMELAQQTQQHAGSLCQVWLPEMTTDGSVMLSTKDLPFCVAGVGDLLALFRCISCRYTFGTDVGRPDMMGAPGRVFLSNEPEASRNVQKYSKEVYLRCAGAQQCKVHSTLLVPLFNNAERGRTVGVLEVVQSTEDMHFGSMIQALSVVLQRFELYTFDGRCTGLPVPMSAVSMATPNVDMGTVFYRMGSAQAGQGSADGAGGGNTQMQYPELVGGQVMLPQLPGLPTFEVHPAPTAAQMVLDTNVNPTTSLEKLTLADVDPTNSGGALLQRRTESTAGTSALAAATAMAAAAGADAGTARGGVDQGGIGNGVGATAAGGGGGDVFGMMQRDAPTPSSAAAGRPFGGGGPAGGGGMGSDDGGEEDDVDSEGDGMEDGGGSGGSGSALQRRGKGTGNPGKPGKKLRLEDLQSQFGVGLKEAAAKLGICPTTLKRACRRHGIQRWPRRQLVKISKAIDQIQATTKASTVVTNHGGGAGGRRGGSSSKGGAQGNGRGGAGGGLSNGAPDVAPPDDRWTCLAQLIPGIGGMPHSLHGGNGGRAPRQIASMSTSEDTSNSAGRHYDRMASTDSSAGNAVRAAAAAREAVAAVAAAAAAGAAQPGSANQQQKQQQSGPMPSWDSGAAAAAAAQQQQANGSMHGGNSVHGGNNSMHGGNSIGVLLQQQQQQQQNPFLQQQHGAGSPFGMQGPGSGVYVPTAPTAVPGMGAGGTGAGHLQQHGSCPGAGQPLSSSAPGPTGGPSSLGSSFPPDLEAQYQQWRRSQGGQQPPQQQQQPPSSQHYAVHAEGSGPSTSAPPAAQQQQHHHQPFSAALTQPDMTLFPEMPMYDSLGDMLMGGKGGGHGGGSGGHGSVAGDDLVGLVDPEVMQLLLGE